MKALGAESGAGERRGREGGVRGAVDTELGGVGGGEWGRLNPKP